MKKYTAKSIGILDVDFGNGVTIVEPVICMVAA